MIAKLVGFMEQLPAAMLVFIAAFAGGGVDYANQIKAGAKTWTLAGFAVHVITACFFGWCIAQVAAGLGYSNNLVGPAAGMGGFLGTRISDLLLQFLTRVVNTPK